MSIRPSTAGPAAPAAPRYPGSPIKSNAAGITVAIARLASERKAS
jgi:hypothetical protein